MQSSLKGAEAFRWLHGPRGIAGGMNCLTEQVHRWWIAQGPGKHTSVKFLTPCKTHSATWHFPFPGLSLSSRVPMPRRSESSHEARCTSLSSSVERQLAWSVSLVRCHLTKSKAKSPQLLSVLFQMNFILLPLKPLATLPAGLAGWWLKSRGNKNECLNLDVAWLAAL